MPLRSREDPDRTQAAAPHQLQLLDLPPPRRPPGLLRQSKVKIVARRGAIDRYVWGDRCLALCRCATCGCVTHWVPMSRIGPRMGVNFRNFDPLLIESTRIRRLDGANTWKVLD